MSSLKYEIMSTLKKLNEQKISQETMDKICSIFPKCRDLFDEGSFYITPKYISKFKDIEEYITEAVNDNRDDFIKESLKIGRDGMLKDIDIFDFGYWIFQDGVNWENHVCTQNSVIDYIYECIILSSEEEQKRMLETLQEIEVFSDEEVLQMWIDGFKESYSKAGVEAIDWYIDRVTSYGGGNLDMVYKSMIKVMENIRDNKNLDGYVGYRKDLVNELREELDE